MRHMERVSTSAFGRSLAALERAAELYEELRTGDLMRTARNSLILEFEICFGQVRPILERCFVELDGQDAAAVEQMSFATLVRTANERGYTDVEWEHWREFRDHRNRTAHAYSEPQADRIAAGMPAFAQAARGLFASIEKKQEVA